MISISFCLGHSSAPSRFSTIFGSPVANNNMPYRRVDWKVHSEGGVLKLNEVMEDTSMVCFFFLFFCGDFLLPLKVFTNHDMRLFFRFICIGHLV